MDADVVVAGAGPAGSAAAIVLARRGLRVLLACPAAPRTERAGETLPAVAGAALRELGLPDPVRAGVAHAATGTTAYWGGAPLEQDALRDPLGPGWHLDRPAFDGWLRAHARAAGARLLPERVDDDGAGQVRARTSGTVVRYRRIVDATGRPARIARGRGVRPRRRDRLVALYAPVRAATAATAADARIRLEATPSGWWYSARTPGGRVVAYLTDADLLDRERRTRAGFAAALAGTRWVLTGGARSPASAPATTAAHGARLEPAAGDGWLAVGDAALAFDPLSSQGVLNALVTGIEGAEATAAALRGDDGAVVAYAGRLERAGAAYEVNRARAYALESRWPDAPFWARRVPAPVR